ncbi:CLC_0170 family protein [Halanaerobaculum tunisiense]
MLKTIITIFKFVYSSYFLFLLLTTGLLIITLDMYHHYQNQNKTDTLISRWIGLSYIILSIIAFIVDKLLTSLGI